MKTRFAITAALVIIELALFGCSSEMSGQRDAGWITLLDGSNPKTLTTGTGSETRTGEPTTAPSWPIGARAVTWSRRTHTRIFRSGPSSGRTQVRTAVFLSAFP